RCREFRSELGDQVLDLLLDRRVLLVSALLQQLVELAEQLESGGIVGNGLDRLDRQVDGGTGRRHRAGDNRNRYAGKENPLHRPLLVGKSLAQPRSARTHRPSVAGVPSHLCVRSAGVYNLRIVLAFACVLWQVAAIREAGGTAVRGIEQSP